MRLRIGREALARTMADLVDYTRSHFRDEERLMREYGYDGLRDQESQHRYFAEKMVGMQQQVTTGNTMITIDLMDFLKDWLIKHILGSDKKYQDFFKSKGVN
jgi:hemerythrin-like metal-binding protein